MTKTHSEKIREALSDLGTASPREIMDWIKRQYPDGEINPQSYRGDLIGCSVNHSSAHHYPGMPKFLWFENETKQYRLARSDELQNPQIREKLKPTKPNNGSTYIDGIPVSTLSITGQVVIPQKIREKMGFQTGDTLAFIINEQGVLEVRKAKLKLDFV